MTTGQNTSGNVTVGTDARGRRGTSNALLTVAAYGEPTIWLTGGALVLCVIMIAGLLALIVYSGLAAFWPRPVLQIETLDGRVILGEPARKETFQPDADYFDQLPPAVREKVRAKLDAAGGTARRILLRTGNFELTNEHFTWVDELLIAADGIKRPEWAMVFERLAWGRFYGFPKQLLIDDKPAAQGPEDCWRLFCELHPQVCKRRRQKRRMERWQLGKINYLLEDARLELRQCELDYGVQSPQYQQKKQWFEQIEKQLLAQADVIRDQVTKIDAENSRYKLVVETVDGQQVELLLADIVRAYPANRLSLLGKLQVYFARVWEFLSDEPREANSEGGVFPAIFGTLVMTLLMCVMVTPLGVIVALYLREYARKGPVVSIVRIAVNNLAGVPSIVYGVFGLGFFCYVVGGTIDQVFFRARLPSPTFGTGGVLWASLTLAILTLPVVIVSSEEALAAVPNSMREGSYACGATKWQTIRRVVLPRAMPGILTGVILAMARGAGEVAPLMLVGAVKLAPDLPIDNVFPYIHLERSFMHLGFHIYDLGFQSQNSEAAKPMVFATTLLLILIVFTLNAAAIWLRSRLRRKFEGIVF